MAIFTGYLIALLAAAIAYQFSEGKPKKKKYKIWGFTIMLVISPSLAFGLGLTYAVLVKSGWAAMIMFYLFPLFFLIGLFVLLAGIRKKKDANSRKDSIHE
ncbi:hypothetical protein [Sediminibacillus halophilus]|uniref:Uncharacterized protein n=1 Tax=Sediminibacillus halophilus TaxID=482461 RepID=A0A1G9S3N3_9BACI|nr:hypothetical protein [Sediminibacillus halophilus]SDM30032.1 hypothetical protein SAMN05216244_2265 [Sediminibacillus halophilus]